MKAHLLRGVISRVGAASLTLGLPLMLMLAGCPSCPYESRCEGNVLKSCFVGVDQLVGSPAWSESACTEPNAVCVNVDSRSAQCVIDEARRCDDDAEPRCEGGSVVRCRLGFEVAEDCEGHDNACFELPSGARCAQSPLRPCDAEAFERRCEGGRVVECQAGYVKSIDCRLNDPNSVCKEYVNDYGRGAYCD